MKVKLTEVEEKQIRNALGQCWANVAHDVEAQYKNGNIPISHAVCVVLDLFHPARQMCKLDNALYSKFYSLSNTAKNKLARSIL